MVKVEDVDAAVPEALDASKNTMEWLWDGLPPAERVVASALAEAGPTAIAPETLEQLLRDSGVRVVIRELQSAPQLLQAWDLIEPTDGGYRFRVELLRRWIAEQKPLRRVQAELDYIEPVAENLHQAALGLYQGGQLDAAVGLLRQAIGLNPNHVRANQLLADILLAQGHTAEAVSVLERLYPYQPAAARPRLIQALLAQAQAAELEDQQLGFYERVLRMDPAQPEATEGKRRIWKHRGDAALEAGDVETAREAYGLAGIADVDSLAEDLHQTALGLYQGGEPEAAVAPLRRAVALNPNHVRSNQLLADILLGQGRMDEALGVLERLFERKPDAAVPRLIQVLLAQAQVATSEAHQLELYERVLGLDTAQPAAAAAREQIWRRRADAAVEAGDLQAALQAYQAGGIADGAGAVEQELRRRQLAVELEVLERAEQGGDEEGALKLAQALAERYPADRDWAPDLQRLERRVRLKELYQRGLGALQSGDQAAAQALLAQVVGMEPGYEEASRYLHLAVKGIDLGGLPPWSGRRIDWRQAALPAALTLVLWLIAWPIALDRWLFFYSAVGGGILGVAGGLTLALTLPRRKALPLWVQTLAMTGGLGIAASIVWPLTEVWSPYWASLSATMVSLSGALIVWRLQSAAAEEPTLQLDWKRDLLPLALTLVLWGIAGPAGGRLYRAFWYPQTAAMPFNMMRTSVYSGRTEDSLGRMKNRSVEPRRRR